MVPQKLSKIWTLWLECLHCYISAAGFYTLRKDVESTSQRVEVIRASAGLQQLEADLADLERVAADSSLWDDRTKAQQTLVALTDVKDKLKLLNEFRSQVKDATFWNLNKYILIPLFTKNIKCWSILHYHLIY